MFFKFDLGLKGFFQQKATILEVLKATVATLETEHTKTTKVARGRARSAANELKTLAAEFKRNSLVEDKTK